MATVKAVRVEWARDYLRDGPGGPGWAYGSFDMIRPGTEVIELSDGRVVRRQTSSEAEEHWRVGDEFPHIRPRVVRPPMAQDGIPF